MHEHRAGRSLTRILSCLGALVSLLPCSVHASEPTSAPEAGSIDEDGFRLRYRIEGAGLPAIVIGSSVYYPRAFSENLRKHLRLVFMDHRGFGVSPGPVDVSAFALPVLVDDVERLRQTLDLDRVIVIGHSGHAFMALEYAKKYPQHVTHVVMIGIAPDLSVAGTAAADRYWQESVSPERKAALAENVRRLPDDQLAKLPPDRQFIENYIRDGPKIWYDYRFDSSPLWVGVEVNADVLGYVWGTVFRDIDITRGLSDLTRPVLLALGRYDFVVAPPSSWDRVRAQFRDLTVRVFEHSGHTPQLEEAALFDRELIRWLSAHE
jgi:proline iminopeptidase